MEGIKLNFFVSKHSLFFSTIAPTHFVRTAQIGIGQYCSFANNVANPEKI